MAEGNTAGGAQGHSSGEGGALVPATSGKYVLLMATVSLGSIFAPLNSTMIAAALPEIRDDFGVGHAAVAWLVSAYLIAMAVSQPIGGRLGDQLGRARVFRVCLLLFLACSLGAAAAPAYPALVLLRAAQAIAGAAVMPTASAMVRDSVSQARLGRSLGVTGSASGLSAALGPPLGAALLAAGSWRLLFLMNVPLVAVTLLCLSVLRYPDHAPTGRAALDWQGMGLFTGLLAALTVALSGLRGAASLPTLAGATAVAAVTGVLFARRQAGSPLPVAEWSLFRNRSFAAATGYILLSNLVMYTTLLSVPFFVEEVQGKGPASTGGLLGPMFLLMALLSPVMGGVSDFVGRRPLAMAGAATQFVAAVSLAVMVSEDVEFLPFAAGMVVMGLGMGLGWGPASTAAIESAPPRLTGAAAGTNFMMRYLGSIVGTGVLGGVLGTGSGAAPGSEVFRAIFMLLAFMAVLAFIAAASIHRFPRGPHIARQAASDPAGTDTRGRA